MRISIYKIALAAVAAAVLGACDKGVTAPDNVRTLTVICPVTKTTVDYEGSDVSHLVWNEKDTVAYVTSCAGDVVKFAEVKSNTFQAVLPSSASSSDRLFVVYPCGKNEGKTLGELTASILPEVTQKVIEPFDGRTYPMLASVPVPPAGTNTVSMTYDLPAAVLRFRVSAEGRPAKIPVRSLELSANEPLGGVFKASTASEDGFQFTAGETSKTVLLEGPDDSLATGEKGLYVYAVVPRSNYTSFTVKVVTDSLSYTFADGKMDLTRSDRSLYRIELDLSKVQGEAPDPNAGTVFKPVVSMDELNQNSRYLIVAEKDELSYYLAAPDNLYSTSSKPNGVTQAVKSTTVQHSDGSIERTEELMKFIIALEPGTVKENTFAIRFVGAGENTCNYACAPGAASLPVNNGFFMNPSPTTDSEEQGYWAFSMNGGNVVVRSRRTATQRFRFVVDHNEFRPCRDDAEDYDYTVRELKFLRLQ